VRKQVRLALRDIGLWVACDEVSVCRVLLRVASASGQNASPERHAWLNPSRGVQTLPFTSAYDEF